MSLGEQGDVEKEFLFEFVVDDKHTKLMKLQIDENCCSAKEIMEKYHIPESYKEALTWRLRFHQWTNKDEVVRILILALNNLILLVNDDANSTKLIQYKKSQQLIKEIFAILITHSWSLDVHRVVVECMSTMLMSQMNSHTRLDYGTQAMQFLGVQQSGSQILHKLFKDLVGISMDEDFNCEYLSEEAAKD